MLIKMNPHRKSRRSTMFFVHFMLGAATIITLPGQTFTTLVNFNGANGERPYSIIQGFDANGYGTTVNGGTNNYGTIFKVTPGGELTTIYNFSETDGSYPYSTLVLASNGDSYGATQSGGDNSCAAYGASGCGTIFRITATDKLTTLHKFTGPEGASPWALIQATSGNFYGITSNGGLNPCTSYGGGGCGTIFTMTPSGKLSSLYSFCSQANCTDGRNPSSIIQGSDGNFYGTTNFGGPNSCFGLPNQCGIIFKVTPAGIFTVLHSFGGADGAYPIAPLLQTGDGNFYGTTDSGGVGDDGTIFKITPQGTFTTLHNFHGTDGSAPQSPLTQAADGNFYGTATGGGAYGHGAIFKFKTTLTVLHSFDWTDGAVPVAMMQATDGNFYGTASQAGSGICTPGLGCGTVFSLSVGLAPFVKTLPTSGKIGSTVKILGPNLTGATSVTFNGVPATFSVSSPTYITTTVPTSATTGKVQVATPSATLVSNVKFIVR